MQNLNKCQMCGLEVENLTKHHCCPQSKCKNKYKEIKEDESNIAWICRSCHDFLHATWDNNQLRDMLGNLELILKNEQVQKFIAWKRKHPDFTGHSKMSNKQKRHGKI